MKAWPSIALTARAAPDAHASRRCRRSRTRAPSSSRPTDDALVVLKDKSLQPEQKVHKLEEIAYARFDFDTMARLVLARNWAKLSPEQQQEFVREFKRHLSVTYGKNIENYRNETIEISGDREEARGDWTVKTKILRGGGRRHPGRLPAAPERTASGRSSTSSSSASAWSRTSAPSSRTS